MTKSILDDPQWRSAVYSGHVRHRRFVPNPHDFKYPLFMMALDLDELPALFKKKWYMGTAWFHPVRFKRDDFFNPNTKDLKQAVIDRVQGDFTAWGLESPTIRRITLLTHLRYFNFTFNPVSFYYCYDEDDRLVAIQAEITNTPWKERHSYVLPINEKKLSGMEHQPIGGAKNKHQFRFNKDFHVSPFNPMAMSYRWVFNEPDGSLLVHMDNDVVGDDHQSIKHFDATLTMEKRDIHHNLGKTLIQYPFMTVKVVIGIYWQAFKLFIKGSPFYSHPNENS